jgi:hypothetical protein
MTQRQLTSAVTMTVLAGTLVFATVIGWKAVIAPMPGLSAGDSCHMENLEQTIRIGDVQVSVYNAGTKAGLAGEYMTALTERGFREGSLGNTEADVKTVEIRASTEDSPEARLVALQFGRNVEAIYSDSDLGPGVDVIVGDKVKGLRHVVKKLNYLDEVEVCDSTS